MSTREIRSYLTTVKIHIDQVDTWLRQLADMVYEIEEKIMDMEDAGFNTSRSCKKQDETYLNDILEKVQRQNALIGDCPTRPFGLHSGRCGIDDIAAVGLAQEN